MGKAIYMLSDIHLGAPNPKGSLIREKHLVRWLNEVAADAEEIYLLGDVFDFWFEYTHAVPRGYTRLLGKLAELSDQGVNIHMFTGNHDLWIKDYFPTEIGAQVYYEPIMRDFFGETYYLAHGDGLGPGDTGYKIMKKVFIHPLSKWLFARLHPNFGIGLALKFSRHGGNHDYKVEEPEDNELDSPSMHIHSQEVHKIHPHIRYFIYGHRHKLIREPIGEGMEPELIILGDWIHYFSYLRIDSQGPEILRYPLTLPTNVQV